MITLTNSIQLIYIRYYLFLDITIKLLFSVSALSFITDEGKSVTERMPGCPGRGLCGARLVLGRWLASYGPECPHPAPGPGLALPGTEAAYVEDTIHFMQSCICIFKL